ncbi:MAG: hypothetical protein U0X92_11835 [Anaerolineales bacterium]
MKERFWSSFWKILYQLGLFVVWFVSFSLFRDISPELQWVLALSSSIIWFLSSILLSEIHNVPEELKEYHVRWRWVGAVNLFLAVLFFTVIKPGSDYEIWTQSINLFFGSLSMTAVYIIVVAYLFPAILQETAPLPNPIEDLPESTKSVIEKGKKWIGYAQVIPLAGFFLIGSLGFFINTTYFRNEGIDLFIIFSFSGVFVGISLGIVATYKWQKWARESGIPEEELKAAAKLAGLWWPKKKRLE